MKNKWLVIMGIVGAVAVNQAQAITLDFSSITGGDIVFSGSSFSFANASSGPGSGYSYQITGSSGAGTAINDYGNFTPGSYTIGSITTLGALQTANVTGTGSVNISDGGLDLTGTLVWSSIQTYSASGGINAFGTLNVTSISYTGTQSDLIALAALGVASDNVTFQFSPGETLSQLVAGPTFSGSFSGAISNDIPDGGATVMLLGAALSAMGLLRRKLIA